MDINDLISLGQAGTEVIGGWQQVLTPSSPAAGEAYTYTVPGQYWERPISVNFRLVTSATAGTRYPRVVMQDGSGNTIAEDGDISGIAASSTERYRLSARLGHQWVSGSGRTWGAIPDILLHAGWKLVITSSSLAATDQIDTIVILTQRFPSGTVRGTR